MFGLHSQLRVILALRNCLPRSTELYKSTERGQPKPLLSTHKALPCSQACYKVDRCSGVKEKAGRDRKSCRRVKKEKGQHGGRGRIRKKIDRMEHVEMMSMWVR